MSLTCIGLGPLEIWSPWAELKRVSRCLRSRIPNSNRRAITGRRGSCCGAKIILWVMSGLWRPICMSTMERLRWTGGQIKIYKLFILLFVFLFHSVVMTRMRRDDRVSAKTIDSTSIIVRPCSIRSQFRFTAHVFFCTSQICKLHGCASIQGQCVPLIFCCDIYWQDLTKRCISNMPVLQV